MKKTPQRRNRKIVIGLASVAVLTGSVLTAATAGAEDTSATDSQTQAVFHRVPFPCGQKWSGQTRADHSPQLAVDFNRSGDKGDKVAASAGGKVVHRGAMDGTSYGNLVVIKHKNGTASYYAHLSKFDVKQGAKVKKGEIIGFVGGTGHPENPDGFGAHLHYEQRDGYGGSSKHIKFNNKNVHYYGTRDYKVKCG